MDERDIKHCHNWSDDPSDDVVRGCIKGASFNYNRATHKPRINGVELIGNKTLDELGIRQYVIDILKEYGLISGGELTPEQIDALNNMTCYIDENGNLVLDYNENILDISFDIENKDLYINNGINAVWRIDNEGNLEVSYEE